MLDADLASLNEVETKVLVQAVKRSQDRFPDDFMFQLTKEESDVLRSQCVTSRPGGVELTPPHPTKPTTRCATLSTKAQIVLAGFFTVCPFLSPKWIVPRAVPSNSHARSPALLAWFMLSVMVLSAEVKYVLSFLAIKILDKVSPKSEAGGK